MPYWRSPAGHSRLAADETAIHPGPQSTNALMGTEKVARLGFGHERSSTVHTAGAFEVWEEALT